MIVVDIQLRSSVSEDRDRTLGTALIANDGTGSASRGNYTITVRRPGGRRREGKVRGFPRRSRSVFELLRRALNDLHEKGQLP